MTTVPNIGSADFAQWVVSQKKPPKVKPLRKAA
jgi:hypothetical protein